MFAESSIHEMSIDDVERISQFVRKVFTDFVSQDYSVDGIEEFLKYIEPSKIKKRNIEIILFC
ncbi:hypothetical protein HQN89_33325 [Paenibacillus frigoriresistens]|nr:hypothetical protein [Paenibacillus frigoriresistens]